MNKQTQIDNYLEKYKHQNYYSMKEEIDLYLENEEVNFIDADRIHILFSNDGVSPIVGIVLRNLIREKKIRKVGMKLSERKVCHHRPIGLFEVIKKAVKK